MRNRKCKCPLVPRLLAAAGALFLFLTVSDAFAATAGNAPGPNEGAIAKDADPGIRGKALFLENRWDEAAEALREAARNHPDSPAIRFLLSTALSRLKRHDEALVEAKKLAEMEPQDGYAIFTLAIAHRQTGQEKEAIEAFKRAAALLPAGPFVDLILRSAYTNPEHGEKAGEEYKRIEKIRSLPPSTVPALPKRETAEAYRLAAGAYEYEIRSHNDPQKYFALGVLYGFVLHYERAALAFERAINLRPDYFEAYILLGYTYGAKGLKHYDRSIEAYRRGIAIKPDSADCLHGLASGYRHLGKRDEAMDALDWAVKSARPGDRLFLLIGYEYEDLKEYGKALDLFGKIVVLDPGNSMAWSAMGRVYSGLKQYSKAAESFRKAVDLRPYYSVFYGELGWAYYHLREFGNAAAAFETEAGLRPKDPLAYTSLGLAYEELRQFDKAVSAFEKALSLEPGSPHLFIGLVLAHFNNGNYGKTIETCRKELARRPDCAECYLWIGTSYGYLGDYENAARAHEKAAAICRKNNDTVCEANVLAKAGGLNLSNNRDVVAESNLERAVAIFREKGMVFEEGLALAKVGSLKAGLGNSKDAIDCFKRALSLFKEAHQPVFALDAYNSLMTFTQDRQEKLGYAKQASDFADQHNLPERGAVFESWKAILSAQDMGSADVEEMRKLAEKLQVLAENLADPFNRVEASLAAGLALFVAKQDARAKAQLESVYQVAVKTNDRNLKASVSRWLAFLAFKAGDFRAANTHYSAAIEGIESMRTGAQSVTARMLALQTAGQVYTEAIGSLKLAGDYEGAFNYAERARGNEFLDITGSNVDVAPRDIDLVKRERFLRLRAFTIEQELNGFTEAEDAGSREKRAALEAELRRAREDHALLLQKMEHENPELFSLFAPSAITAKEVQAILDPGTTLLEYYIAGPLAFLWVVDKSSVRLIELPVKTADLKAKVEAYRKKLKGLRPDYERDASELFDSLIRPAKPFIKTGTVGIVPYGDLHYLPFQALLDVEEQGGRLEKRFLIEEYDLFYAPSAAALKHIYGKRKPLRGKVLAFGNPDVGDRGMDLPNAEAELAEIRKAFPDAALFTRKEATKARATQSSSGYDVIHFASHAELDPKNPLASSIRMAKSGSDDGRLTAREVFGLDLKDASLVTLSACETGLGELKGGDELIGLTRAFVYAGAPSIVASLWPVNDESTSRFMALFYSNLKSLPKAEALRLAQIEMIRGKTGKGIVRGVGGVTTQLKAPDPQSQEQTVHGSHPFFWAPFILLGDWK